MFLKTHKCASSTVQNIVLRYALENDLEIVLPEKIYLGHPRHFKSEMIPSDLRSMGGRYNILAHHARYNPVEMNKILPPEDTVYLTILREPSALFESMYSFYNLGLIYKNITFKDILNNPNKFEKYKRVFSHRYPYRLGLNQMSFDLGFDEILFDNADAISDFITIVSRDFDLVMIAEHMEVSLILLADMMRWPLEQVVYLNHMTRKKKKVNNLTEENRNLLRNLNFVDTHLYDYFLRVLHLKVLDYGVERMQKKVVSFVAMNHKFKYACVQSETYSDYGGTLSYNTKDGATSQCSQSAMSEQNLTEFLRQLQYEKLKGLQSIENLLLVDNSDDQNLDNFTAYRK